MNGNNNEKRNVLEKLKYHANTYIAGTTVWIKNWSNRPYHSSLFKDVKQKIKFQWTGKKIGRNCNIRRKLKHFEIDYPILIQGYYRKNSPDMPGYVDYKKIGQKGINSNKWSISNRLLLLVLIDRIAAVNYLNKNGWSSRILDQLGAIMKTWDELKHLVIDYPILIRECYRKKLSLCTSSSCHIVGWSRISGTARSLNHIKDQIISDLNIGYACFTLT